MAGYAAACGGVERSSRPLLCLDEHNIEYDLVRRTASTSGPLRRAYSALEWRKVRRDERHAWNLYHWFAVHPDELREDGVHPNDRGVLSINRLWGEAVDALYPR